MLGTMQETFLGFIRFFFLSASRFLALKLLGDIIERMQMNLMAYHAGFYPIFCACSSKWHI